MLILIFVLTVLLAATAALLWCLRGFSRTLKQQGFVGVLVRTEHGNAGSAEPQSLAQDKDTGVAEKCSVTPSRRGLLRSGQSMARTEIKIQAYTAETLEIGIDPALLETWRDPCHSFFRRRQSASIGCA